MIKEMKEIERIVPRMSFLPKAWVPQGGTHSFELALRDAGIGSATW